MLFLLTGQRISDVSKLGRQHIRKPESVAPALRKIYPGLLGGLHPAQILEAGAGLASDTPIADAGHASLSNSPCGSLTFIETEFGKPHTTKGLGDWFADQCLLAGVPGRAHGLRKAGATIAAENGATPYQLMSIFGWKTLEQAELYTKAVRQQLMAAGSMHLIGFDQSVNESDPPEAGVTISGSLSG